MGLVSKQGSAPAHQCTQIILFLLNCLQSYIIYHQYLLFRLPWQLSGKESSCQYRRHRFNSWVRKIPWRRKQQPSSVFLPGKCLGQRSMVSCSPWGSQRDMAQRLNSNICFTHGAVYMSVLVSQFVSLSPFIPDVHTSVLLRLQLYSCLGNRFICTFFVDYTFMC